MALRYRTGTAATEAKRAPSTRRYEQLYVYVGPNDVRTITPAEYVTHGIQSSAVNPFSNVPWIKGEREYVDYQATCNNVFSQHIYDDPLSRVSLSTYAARRELLYEWATSLLAFPVGEASSPLAYLKPEQLQQIEHEARCFLELSDFVPFLREDWNRETAEQYLSTQPPGAFLFRPSSVSVDDANMKMFVLSFKATNEQKQQTNIWHQLFAWHPYLGILTFESVPPASLVPGDTNWNEPAQRHFNSVVELMEDTLPAADPSGKAWIEYLNNSMASVMSQSPCVSLNTRVDCSECAAPSPANRRCEGVCLLRGASARCNRFALPFERYCLQHMQDELARRAEQERKQQEEVAARSRYRTPARPAQAIPTIPAGPPDVAAVRSRIGTIGVSAPTPAPLPPKIANRVFEAPPGTGLYGTTTEVMDETEKKQVLTHYLANLRQEGKYAIPAEVIQWIERYIAGLAPDIYVRLFYGTQRNKRWLRPMYIQVYQNEQPLGPLIHIQMYEWSTSVNAKEPVPFNFPAAPSPVRPVGPAPVEVGVAERKTLVLPVQSPFVQNAYVKIVEAQKLDASEKAALLARLMQDSCMSKWKETKMADEIKQQLDRPGVDAVVMYVHDQLVGGAIVVQQHPRRPDRYLWILCASPWGKALLDVIKEYYAGINIPVTTPQGELGYVKVIPAQRLREPDRSEFLNRMQTICIRRPESAVQLQERIQLARDVGDVEDAERLRTRLEQLRLQGFPAQTEPVIDRRKLIDYLGRANSDVLLLYIQDQLVGGAIIGPQIAGGYLVGPLAPAVNEYYLMILCAPGRGKIMVDVMKDLYEGMNLVLTATVASPGLIRFYYNNGFRFLHPRKNEPLRATNTREAYLEAPPVGLGGRYSYWRMGYFPPPEMVAALLGKTI